MFSQLVFFLKVLLVLIISESSFKSMQLCPSKISVFFILHDLHQSILRTVQNVIVYLVFCLTNDSKF